MRLIFATGSIKKMYNTLVQRDGLIEGYFSVDKKSTSQQ